MTYTVETTADRLSAIDDAGHEICGAFYRASHWNLFVDNAYLEAYRRVGAADADVHTGASPVMGPRPSQRVSGESSRESSVNHCFAICDVCRKAEVFQTPEAVEWWLGWHKCEGDEDQ